MNRTNSLKTLGLTTLAVLVGASLFTLAWASHRRPVPVVRGENGKRTPVVVELFTSEGCSSCPPADAVLARLKRDQPVDGAEVIALSEHVDYWNYIGWADPFSAKEFSARQSGYARALKLDQVYTPQAVIDGQTEFVGSDQGRAEAEIARAARTPKAEVHLARDTSASGDVALRVQIDKAPEIHTGGTVDVLLAITEDNLHSNVARGENAGRNLNHVAVVRQLRRIGSLTVHQPFTAAVPLKLNSTWKRRDLSAVVFVQQRDSGHILGATTLPLN
jgi:hypothetical protein